MRNTATYPERSRKNVQKITASVPVSEETAYAMMLMTAMLMDLSPDDERVPDMILKDCGVTEAD